MMHKLPKKWALAAGVGVTFVAGVMIGKRMSAAADSTTSYDLRSDETGATKDDLQRPPASQSSNRAIDHTATTLQAVEQQAVLIKIRNARQLPDGARMKPLMLALEESTKLDLTKELLDELRSIVSEGQRESSDYVISLMEQREDKSSVDFLLEAAGADNTDVSTRALFALEAVAGNVFKNREEALVWATSWQPAADRAILFSPTKSGENHDFSDRDTQQIGPMRNIKKPINPVDQADVPER